MALLVPAIGGQIWATSVTPTPTLILITVILSVAFFAFIIMVISASVFRSGAITADRIAGAICVFLLVGLFWSMLYGAVSIYNPEAFRLPGGTPSLWQNGGLAELDFIYFSFVTLTTLGFGDISPVSPLARTLTWMQAVFGQLYIAILLARMVSLHVAQSRQNPGGDASQEPADPPSS